MEDLVRQRVIRILRENNSTVNSLSKGNSSLQRKFNRQINEGSAITIETISSILEAYPSVSAEWLLTGKGEMLKSTSVVSYLSDEKETEYKDTIRNLEAEINQLKGENRILREQAGLGEREVGNDKSA